MPEYNGCYRYKWVNVYELNLSEVFLLKEKDAITNRGIYAIYIHMTITEPDKVIPYAAGV